MQNKSKPIIEYLINYLDFLEIERGLSSKTQESYSRFLNKFFNWLNSNSLDKLKPEELNAKHILKYRIFLSRNIINSRTKATLK